MSAREEILGRVRSALADVTDPDVTETPVHWTYGATVDTGDLGLVDRFAERVADYRATVRRVRCRKPKKIAGCRRCRHCCVSNSVVSTSPVTAPSWTCCSPDRAVTLVRSLDGHNIFNPFTSPVLAA